MKRVLLIRLSSLGDLVLLTSAIEALSELSCEVHLLTSWSYREVFEGDPRISRLLLFRGDRREIVEKLRDEKFDVAIDMHCKALSLYFLLMTKASKKAVIRKRILARQLALHLRIKIKEVSVTELYLQPIRKLFGYNGPTPLPSIKAYFEKGKFSHLMPYALLFPGAKSPTRVWPYYPELAELIKNQSELNVVVAGSVEDRKVASELYKKFRNIVDLTGKTSISDLFSLVESSQFVVANDSGPAHIASAFKKPLVVFFGPTITAFGFRPPGEKVIVMEKDIKCRPCSIHGEKKCKRGDLLCLASISPDEVFETIERYGFLDCPRI